VPPTLIARAEEVIEQPSSPLKNLEIEVLVSL
jgi:hypothetical protein